jgi:hypothetical protein
MVPTVASIFLTASFSKHQAELTHSLSHSLSFLSYRVFFLSKDVISHINRPPVLPHRSIFVPSFASHPWVRLQCCAPAFRLMFASFLRISWNRLSMIFDGLIVVRREFGLGGFPYG